MDGVLRRPIIYSKGYAPQKALGMAGATSNGGRLPLHNGEIGGLVGLVITNRNSADRLKEYHEECFPLKRQISWSSDVYSATNKTGFCIQPAGLLLERENKTAFGKRKLIDRLLAIWTAHKSN